MFKKAKELIKEGKIKHLMDSKNFGTMYTTPGQLCTNDTRIVKKAGRTEVHCSCNNGTRFCNSPTICKHKIATIVLEFLKQNNLAIKWE